MDVQEHEAFEVIDLGDVIEETKGDLGAGEDLALWPFRSFRDDQ